MVTLDYQVATSADDGYWSGSSTFNNATADLPLGGLYGSARNIFCRWAGVTIPAGAKITSAYVSFAFRYYSGSSGTSPECTLYFEDAANPLPISSASDGNDRIKTTANIGVTSPMSGEWWNTDSIVSIIQELVDSHNYSTGAAMQMIINGVAGSDSSYQWAYEYGDPDGLWAPKLHIEYTFGDHCTSSSRGMFRGMFNKMR